MPDLFSVTAPSRAAVKSTSGAISSNALQLGPFMLEPGEVEIPPGGKQDVQVVFKAEGNSSYKAVAGISISERDFEDQPAGIPYELGGESCIPGEYQSSLCGYAHAAGSCSLALQSAG